MLEETIKKYEEGKILYLTHNLSLTQIAKQLKIHRGRFTEYLKRQNIQIENKQNISRRYSDVFANVDTEEKAYWLGFLYADGYVGTETNHIEIALQPKDISHLQKFAHFINFDGNIQKSRTRARISFRDKEMHNDLITLGCIPQKSLVLSFPTEEQVPKYLIKHFVRGYVDGDGYVGINSYGRGRLGITCGSEQFLTDLANAMNWEKHKIVKDKRNNTKNLEYGGWYVYEMLSVLYKNSSVYLDRKFEKFIEIENAVLSRMS